MAGYKLRYKKDLFNNQSYHIPKLPKSDRPFLFIGKLEKYDFIIVAKPFIYSNKKYNYNFFILNYKTGKLAHEIMRYGLIDILLDTNTDTDEFYIRTANQLHFYKTNFKFEKLNHIKYNQLPYKLKILASTDPEFEKQIPELSNKIYPQTFDYIKNENPEYCKKIAHKVQTDEIFAKLLANALGKDVNFMNLIQTKIK